MGSLGWSVEIALLFCKLVFSRPAPTEDDDDGGPPLWSNIGKASPSSVPMLLSLLDTAYRTYTTPVNVSLNFIGNIWVTTS